MKTQISPKNLKEQNFDSHKFVRIVGARQHNLKNISIDIPKNKLIVVTGVSGSGKSSLTIDTLYAEGQRRYVESLSSYARQFMGRMNKPDVDYILGLCPAIAIEQKVTTRTGRSTVGSLTELLDYLRLLYARIGDTISPKSGSVVKKNEVNDVVDYCNSFPEKTPLQILIPFRTQHNRTVKEELNTLVQKGFTRMLISTSTKKIETLLEEIKLLDEKKMRDAFVVIDRIIAEKENAEAQSRLSDSVSLAFFEGEGNCFVQKENEVPKHFSNRFELDGILFEEPSPQFFNYNNPYGACKKCEGFGQVMGIDEDLVVPDKSLSIYEGAIACWRGEKMSEWSSELVKNALKFDFPIHRAYRDLNEEEKKLLWTGNKYFHGLDDFFVEIEKQSYKIQYRVMLSRYRGRTTCPDCKGTRLRHDSSYVKVEDKSITDLVLMPVSKLHEFFQTLTLSDFKQKVARRILLEVNIRLQLMMDVGLGYLTLNRLSSTLSGGETQRIQLTRMLGSNLTNSIYLLDEPSVGLHPHDTGRLVKVLKQLRDLGNTVVVVEHEEEIMLHADRIIDIGPAAGIHGGEIIFNGTFDEIMVSKSLTGKYLSGKEEIKIPKQRRSFVNRIELKECFENNLKNISVTIPLGVMTCVTGVSGSGKTTLIKKILYPALQREFNLMGEKPGNFKQISGDIKSISLVEMIDQNPIGKSSRSNPVTYIKAYDAIRDLFADQHAAKMRGFKAKHFSFNVEGGRCETCQGDGEVVVEMQFMADVHLLCEECFGKRFKDEVLEVQWNGKNISEVLDLSVDEAIDFFYSEEKICESIKPLSDVGLGYIKLGQSSSTLSGGEAQRVKLASFLGKGKNLKPILFVFDEPTTGLHFHDIKKLLHCFDALIKKGHTVVVIEHNMEMIKCADYIIDLGPDGGENGGHLLFEGLPEDLIKVESSLTGKYLKEKISEKNK